MIGLQGSVWSRLGSEVTVVEFLGQIGGPGMDAEISKTTKKILEKQGMKFKLNTKVLSGDSSGDGVKLEVEAAKGGKAETVSLLTLLHAVTPPSNHLPARRGRRPRSHRPPPIHRRPRPRKHWPGSRQQRPPDNRRTIPHQAPPHPRHRRLYLRPHARA